jgi:hypothetical protein
MASPAAKLHGALAIGPNRITSRGSPWVAGSKGRATKGDGRRGEVVAGVGATTSARWQCSAGGACALSGRRRVIARARVCAWVRTRVGCAPRA